MILTLYTEGFFDSAHYLNNYEGKCAHLHGHTWKVCVWVKGSEEQKKADGILWDFNNLKKITQVFDHACLNEVMTENPTAENISLFIYRALKKDDPGLEFKVRLYENALSKNSFCETGDF